jgi:hypothetical protein
MTKVKKICQVNVNLKIRFIKTLYPDNFLLKTKANANTSREKLPVCTL